MPGFQVRGESGLNTPPPVANNPLANQYKLYNSGVQQNAEDYSGIMQGYKNLLGSAGGMNGAPSQQYTPQQVQTSQYQYTPGNITPQSTPYQQSSDLRGAIGNLQGLSQTGGYTPEGIAELRARGVSPIRSIYSSAQENIERNRALKGGFSPGYNAAKIKLAREMSDQIGNQVSNVNAGIAQNIAGNKLAIAPQLASVTGAQSDLSNRMASENTGAANQAQLANISNNMRANEFNQGNAMQGNLFNANAANQANQFNIQNAQANRNTGNSQQLAALQGMHSLYGTTPALSNLFGNQAMQGAQFQNQLNQQGQNANLNLTGEGMRSFMGR